jgi:hypothetical protein
MQKGPYTVHPALFQPGCKHPYRIFGRRTFYILFLALTFQLVNMTETRAVSIVGADERGASNQINEQFFNLTRSIS